jgi:Leucine-rich repeat (LRR) protein
MENGRRVNPVLYPPASTTRLAVLDEGAPPPEAVRGNTRPYLKIVLHPSDANHTVHWGNVTWPETTQSLSISRESKKDFPLGSLLNGLELPPWLKSLELSEKESGPSGLPPADFSPCHELDFFSATRIEVESVHLICRASTRLYQLKLCDMVLDLGDWIPMSTRYFSVNRCIIMAWDVCLQALTTLDIESCPLQQLPLRMDMLFPSLEMLYLHGNGIESLQGVVFPSKLHAFDMLRNGFAIDVGDAVFPPTLRSLRFGRCNGIRGLSRLRFPAGLVCLELAHNGLTTTDDIKFPPRLSCIDLEGNNLGDLNYLIRYAALYNTHVQGVDMSAQRRAVLRRYYVNQRGVRALVSARRIHRIGAKSAARKLPGDLLRVALGFLAETPQLQ